MRFQFYALLLAGFLSLNSSGVNAQSAIVTAHKDYRFISMRRHNDIQGVEAVYDDYRRNWLRRYNSELMIGDRPDRGVADTPRCSSVDGGRMTRVNCGGGHIFRTNLTGIIASDNNGANTEETGLLGYLGYEYLFSNDAFLGFGATFGESSIQHRLGGSSLDVETSDLGLHLLTGYRFQNGSMMLWNVSVVSATDDTIRNGTITGSYDSTSLMVTGVWYQSLDLADDLYMSYGLDYTFLEIWPDSPFVDSAGVIQRVKYEFSGDVTPSLMFVKAYDGGEAFARFGSSIEIIYPTDRPYDATIDLGGSVNLSGNTAITGSVGGTYRVGGYFEGRGSVRLVGKF